MTVYEQIPFEVQCDENIAQLFALTIKNLSQLQEQLIARNILTEPIFQISAHNNTLPLKEVQ